MQLLYFDGNNFGDELSPYIFNKLLPDFFDGDKSTLFYGIGSIIGENTFRNNSKKIIFSSGFGNYNGAPPVIDKSCNIFCVRGPITAKLLNLDPSLAITDGAVLLKSFDFPKVEKEYEFSYIPHWISEFKYPWEKLCEEAGIHYISPQQDLMFVLEEIRKTKVIFAEAMHGAIVADIFRIPWIPVKTFRSKYEIKWNDWTKSLSLDYIPHDLKGLYDNNNFVVDQLHDRIKLPKPIIKGSLSIYTGIQNFVITPLVVKKLTQLKKERQFLSRSEILDEKYSQLLEKIEEVKTSYC